MIEYIYFFLKKVDFGMRAVLDNNVAESRYDLALRWFDEHTRSEVKIVFVFMTILVFFFN